VTVSDHANFHARRLHFPLANKAVAENAVPELNGTHVIFLSTLDSTGDMEMSGGTGDAFKLSHRCQFNEKKNAALLTAVEDFSQQVGNTWTQICFKFD
jgi:hypothetical protein